MIRKAWRLLPRRARRALREALRELPIRVRDAVPDLLDRFRRRSLPPPPARLRRRVALSSSRKAFLAMGEEASRNVADIFEAAREASADYPRWLDFGCGPGRVSRHLAGRREVCELWGADVDGEAIAWDAAHLPGRYVLLDADPPTPLPASHFDVVYAASVFTHFDEERQLRWLTELHRILRPGGLLIASTHAPSLSAFRPDLSPEARERLAREGFLFAPGGGPFSEDSAFHSPEYLVETRGKLFGLQVFRQLALNAYQDLAAWKKW